MKFRNRVMCLPIYFGPTSASEPLTAESVGNRWRQEDVRRPDGYPHYHWLQTEEGVGEVVLCGDRIQLSEGYGILIAPFVPHAYHAVQADWRTAFVTFCGRLETGIGEIVGHEKYVLVDDRADLLFLEWIDRIVRSHEARKLEPVRLSIDCYTFLMHIKQRRDDKVFLTHPLYRQYVEPAILEIETRYDQDITVSGLAEAVCVSPQYLSRLFRRFLGCSTYQYLIDYRMKRAKELIVQKSELEIQRVAMLVGYYDASHFISAFKKNTGYTPLDFRRLYRR